MSKNGQIGRGWYEDAVERGEAEDLGTQFEINELAEELLKCKLAEIFNIAKERNRERIEREIMCSGNKETTNET